jgi:hypothetical protein
VCKPPGEAPFKIPQAEGIPNYIGPYSEFPHVYRAETSTLDSNGSLAGPIAEQLIQNPTPGPGFGGPENQPATAEGVLNQALPGIGGGPLGSMVNSYVTTDASGNTVVVNVTVPGG